MPDDADELRRLQQSVFSCEGGDDAMDLFDFGCGDDEEHSFGSVKAGVLSLDFGPEDGPDEANVFFGDGGTTILCLVRESKIWKRSMQRRAGSAAASPGK